MRLFDLSISLNTSYGLCDIIVRIAIGTSRGQSTASVQATFWKVPSSPSSPTGQLDLSGPTACMKCSNVCQQSYNISHDWIKWSCNMFQHLCMFQKGLQFSFLCPCASCPKACKIALGEILSTKIQVGWGWLSEHKTVSVIWRGDEGDVWSRRVKSFTLSQEESYCKRYRYPTVIIAWIAYLLLTSIGAFTCWGICLSGVFSLKSGCACCLSLSVTLLLIWGQYPSKPVT